MPATVVSVHGTNHIDYNNDFNAHSNPTWTKSSEIFAYNENMKTVTFGSEEVMDMFYANSNGTSLDYLHANVGLVTYGKIEDALAAAAESGQELSLIKNATAKEQLLIENGETVVIDLNGKTMTGSIWAKNANLTVKNGTIKNTDASVSGIEINAGTLTLETTVTVESARHALRIDGAVVATVNGGTYKSAQGTGTGTYHAANISGNANVTINGGTFVGPNGNATTTADSGSAINVQSGASVIIKNGTYKGGKTKTLSSEGTLVLYGGKYDQDPTAFVAENYMAEQNTEGLFEVVETIAKIGETPYASLQSAVNAVKNGETITLIADVAENVTVAQAPDVKFTIDGAQKTMNGTITVDGKSEAYATAGVTIKNVKFDATGIAVDACINLGDGTTATRYTNYVTVENCTFTGGNQEKAAIKSYQGGDKNLTVTGCTVENTMHSLIQAANIAGVVVDGCIVKSKNGINLNSSSNVEIMNSTIEVSGYAVRAGVNSGTSGKIKLTDNTLKTNGSEDAVVVIRGTASEQIDLTMTRNVVSGTTHISGTTAATKISADANYWDGNDAPVVNGVDFLVNSYYSDAELTILVKKHYGNDFTGYTSTDGIWGEVWGNAFESFVIKVLNANDVVMGTTSLNNVGGIINGNVNVSWSLKLDAESNTDKYWTMSWETKPTINNMPAKVELWVDGVKVSGGNVVLNGPDNLNKINAAITNDNKEIKSFQTSFANALAAVQAGETIELFADVEATEVILLGKSVTINGNSHNVTSSATRVFRVTTSNTEVTLNDVNMVSTVVRVGTNDVRGIAIDSALENVKLTLNDCSVDFTDSSANDWAYAVNVAGNGTGHIVTVNGGTYEGANVINVYGANNTIVVKNATITSTYPNNNQYYGACIWVLQNQGSSVEATGNTFNGNNAVAFNLGTGTNLTESNNTDNTTRIIAKIGEKYYTLQDAINAAGTTPTTITITADFETDDDYTIASGQNITLNLNGKTITGTDNATGSFGLFNINSGAALTINDGNSNSRSNTAGAITLKATNNREWNAYSSVISNQRGTLVVNGGTIEHLGGTAMAYGIDNLTNTDAQIAETTINGGTVKSTYRAIRQFLNSSAEGVNNILTVKGGTIEGGNKSIWMQDANANANPGTLTIEEDAVVNGNVYLTVTAGSTQWPVTVVIAAEALKDGSEVLTNANVPEGYLLVNENGYYSVKTINKIDQTISLKEGWTWTSLFVDATSAEDLDNVQYKLGENGVQIKNQTSATTRFDDGWYGKLQSLSVGDMYMVKVEEEQTVTINDYQVNPADDTINLVNNWTWIGFPAATPMTLDVLDGIEPVTGDQIKTQDAYATYMAGYGWYGSLKQLTPGRGYMYKNVSGAEKQLTYPSVANYRGVAPANITAASNLMVPNMSKYANNMNITAVVNIDGEELMTEGFEVAVFAGNELRGSARPIYIEEFNRNMLFLTVYGEETEELTFKYYDLNSGKEFNLFADNEVVFEVNATLGSLEDAIVLSRGALSIDETSANSFNVYPNPVNRDNAIRFETTYEKVEVYNSLGVVVAEYANVDQISGIEAAGIYVIKVANDNVVKYSRVIVK